MRKVWTVRFALALIVAAVLDIVSTYIGSPDLSLEANPLFVMIGRKWTYVITIKVAWSLFALVAFTKALKILQTRVDRLKGITGFVNVFSYLIFKRRLSLVELLLYRLPKDWIPVLAVGAIAFGTTIVTGGVTAAILNTLGVIQTQAQLMVFWFGAVALGIGTALWVTYQFLAKQQKAEQGAECDVADHTH